MAKCLQCGTAMKTRRETYPYDRLSGGLAVTLKNVRVSRCPNCGEWEVEIPRIDELHRLIAKGIVEKRSRLAPPEIRFLRKRLEWSASDFAAAMGSTAETVSRWENGRMPMGAAADRLLRLAVVANDGIDDYTLDALRAIAKDVTAPVPVGLVNRANKWVGPTALAVGA